MPTKAITGMAMRAIVRATARARSPVPSIERWKRLKLKPTTASIRWAPPGKYHNDMWVATTAQIPTARSRAVVSSRGGPRRRSAASS